MASEPTTLDLTRYYLEHMSEVDLQDLEEIGRLLIPGLSSGFFEPPDPRINELISQLPRLTDSDLDALHEADSACPICLIPLKAAIAEEEMAQVMEHSAATPVEELGVTRLEKSCGHIYCRKDIIKWMRTASKSCPTCRQPFLPPLEGASETGIPPTGEQDGPSRESDAFSLPATEEEMREFLRRATLPSTGTGSQRANAIANFERFMFGSAAGRRATGRGGQREEVNEDDRQEYYGMYS